MKKWTLSNKIGWTNYENCRLFIGHKFILVEDVQEFIRRFKDKINGTCMAKDNVDDIVLRRVIFEIIDNLAGEKLGGKGE